MAIDDTTLALLVTEAFGLHDVRPFTRIPPWFRAWVAGNEGSDGVPLLHVNVSPAGTFVKMYGDGHDSTELDYRNVSDVDGVRRVLRDAKAELVAAGCVFGGAK